MFLNKIPANHFPFASFPLVQFLLIVFPLKVTSISNTCPAGVAYSQGRAWAGSRAHLVIESGFSTYGRDFSEINRGFFSKILCRFLIEYWSTRSIRAWRNQNRATYLLDKKGGGGCATDEEAIWETWFTCFLVFFLEKNETGFSRARPV